MQQFHGDRYTADSLDSREIQRERGDARRTVAPAEQPRTPLHRLQCIGVLQQRGDTIQQLAIRDQSADAVTLQESDVESFLTAERTRRQQRPAARERFGDA